jgi:uncharacterized protein (TIGR02145 family)
MMVIDPYRFGNNHVAYGALYNWYAAVYNNAGETICPTGWHLPTADEQEALMLTIDPDGTGVNTAGGELKEAGYSHWLSPNTSATNNTGFTAVGSGIRDYLTGEFSALKILCNFWESNSFGTDGAISALYNSGNRFDGHYGGSWSTLPKPSGISIRLIKDNDTNDGTVTDYDGNTYPTVKIGDQVWMAQNLRVTSYNNGTPIPHVTDPTAWAALNTGAYCWYNNQ